MNCANNHNNYIKVYVFSVHPPNNLCHSDHHLYHHLSLLSTYPASFASPILKSNCVIINMSNYRYDNILDRIYIFSLESVNPIIEEFNMHLLIMIDGHHSLHYNVTYHQETITIAPILM